MEYKKNVEEFGYSVIVASEGLKNQNGKFYSASDAKIHLDIVSLVALLQNLLI